MNEVGDTGPGDSGEWRGMSAGVRCVPAGAERAGVWRVPAGAERAGVWRVPAGAERAGVWRVPEGAERAAGVAAAVALAVLAPRLGAPGGPLRAEYCGGALQGYVHYAAGRRGAGRGAWRGRGRGARALAACVAHALVVSPALAAALLVALPDGVDYRIAQGVMLWSSGGGCSWLSLSLSWCGSCGAAAAASALVYVASLLATPLHTALLCGRAALPSLPGVAATLCTTAAPFAAGALVSALLGAPPGPAGPPPRGVRLAALLLLYAECCERLCDAEAIVHPGHVLVAFALEASCVLVSAAWCSLYARAGLLSAGEARLVAQCALPRSLDTRWSLSCAARGLSRLPGVFVAPTQALVLAALAHDEPDPGDVLPASSSAT